MIAVMGRHINFKTMLDLHLPESTSIEESARGKRLIALHAAIEAHGGLM
jgi:hypothetical protein